MTGKNSPLFRSALVIMLAAGLMACAPRVANRGNLPTDAQLAKVKAGESTRQSVAEALGTPSTVGTFDDKVWYYISRKTEKLAFFSEDVVDQQVIAVHFDDRGVVDHIEHYTKEDGRDIELVSRETPSAGHSPGFFEQIFGNLGRFNKNTPVQ